LSKQGVSAVAVGGRQLVGRHSGCQHRVTAAVL
jgi:hypothetical protein